MPNLCENKVVIRGGKQQLDRLEQAATRQAENEAFDQLGQELLNAVIPVPDYLRNAEISNTFTVTDRTDWKIENWGTKYTMNPIFSRKDDRTLELTFRSAWSPPLYVYQTLVEDWGLQVKALFFESRGCYAGSFENEKYSRFNDIKPENVHDLPKELRDAFGIESCFETVSDEIEQQNPGLRDSSCATKTGEKMKEPLEVPASSGNI